MKKVWNFVTTVVLVVLLAFIAIMYVPKIFGIEPMIVLSGSMEPTYHVGSLLYVKEADTDKVEVGDPITFYLDESTLVKHRVVDIDEKNRTYTTKGDANNAEDGTPVSFDQVLGIPVFNIPQAGYLADKVSQTSGKIIYIVVIIVDLILMFMGDLIWSDEKEKDGLENEKSKKHDSKED